MKASADKSLPLPLIFAVLLALLGAGALAGEIDPGLAERIALAGPAERIPVLVRFRERADLSRFERGRASAGALIRELRAKSELSRSRVADGPALRGLAKEPRFFWIVNAMALEAEPARVRELAALPEVALVSENKLRRWLPETTFEPVPAGVRTPEWHLDKIGAPLAWSDLGLDGSGVLVGVMDTGVFVDHEGLAGKWRGGTNSWLDVVNGMPDPYDDAIHGTFVTGLIVGGDGDAGPLVRDTGPAYNARFIAAKIFPASGDATDEQIIMAGEWMLDPDGDPGTDDFPHIVNNSWGTDDPFTGYHDMVSAWRTAGIVPVVAIGNSGPAAMTTNAPGNYGNVIGVGGTDIDDDRYDSTSVGPAPVGPEFAPDGRKPDISAPGEGVLSAFTSAVDGYAISNGTSLATPLVSGAAALMLQRDPSLDYDGVMRALRETAVDLGDPGYDFVFGYGRIDAYAAATFDQTAPTLDSVAARTGLSVDATFSEPMGPGALDPASYTLSGSGQGTLADNPDMAEADPARGGAGPQTFRLTWASGEMVFGGDIAIAVDPLVEDLAGNPMNPLALSATHLGGGLPVELSAFALD